MTRVQEYNRIKQAREKADIEWRDYLRPKETDLSKMMEIYEETREFLGGKITHQERDMFINAILLVYSPRTILDKKKCANGVVEYIGVCIGANRSLTSRWLSAAVARYHLIPSVREGSERLYRYLTSVPPLRPYSQ